MAGIIISTVYDVYVKKIRGKDVNVYAFSSKNSRVELKRKQHMWYLISNYRETTIRDCNMVKRIQRASHKVIASLTFAYTFLNTLLCMFTIRKFNCTQLLTCTIEPISCESNLANTNVGAIVISACCIIMAAIIVFTIYNI